MSPPTPSLEPWDEHNRQLADHVHPADWTNPTPRGRYNLVVIGAGTAGLVTAAGAAGLGARVALVERLWMGGDCLNVGCVPSKALLRSAHAAAESRHLEPLGIASGTGTLPDFTKVMERVRRLRATIAPHDSARRFRELGVDVYFGDARFTGPDSIEVNGTHLPFARAVIASGARALLPNIPGLADASPLTNENVFNLTELPRRLAVLGGGPIGCELAQAFRRLGSEVLLLHNKSHLLDREDPDAAAIVQDSLVRDGVQLALDTTLDRVESRPDGRHLHFRTPTGERFATVDAILVGAGRRPNVESLGLDRAGIAFHPREGVQVDDFLRTSHPRVYACGDVCMRWKFTHAADIAARIVIQNALFSVGPIGRRRLSSLTMPWCTYTDPEVAHVGIGAAEARTLNVLVDTYTVPFESVDRAITDGETTGFIRIHTRKGTDRIVGATIVGRGAGDMISEITTAMAGGLGLGRLASVIHPYPTRADAIRKAGDLYNKTRLTPTVRNLFHRWLAWRR